MGSFGFPFSWRGPVTYWRMRIYEKLDLVFCNDTSRDMYSEALVRVLHRLEFFDHHPILLTLMDKDFRQAPKSFKFECARLVKNSFEDMLKATWNNQQSLLLNLESFKITSTQWNLLNIGSIHKEKLQLLRRLHGIQKAVQVLAGDFDR